MANDKLTAGPSPEANSVRQGPSGDHLTPEGARANFTGSTRGQYPKGSEPRPEGIAQGPSGSSQDGSFGKGSPAAPIATRKGGERTVGVGSLSNPFGGSKSDKHPL